MAPRRLKGSLYFFFVQQIDAAIVHYPLSRGPGCDLEEERGEGNVDGGGGRDRSWTEWITIKEAPFTLWQGWVNEEGTLIYRTPLMALHKVFPGPNKVVTMEDSLGHFVRVPFSFVLARLGTPLCHHTGCITHYLKSPRGASSQRLQFSDKVLLLLSLVSWPRLQSEKEGVLMSRD